MNDYIEKPDIQYILHIKSDKKVEKRLIDYCLKSVIDVFEDTGLTADVQPIVETKDKNNNVHNDHKQYTNPLEELRYYRNLLNNLLNGDEQEERK